MAALDQEADKKKPKIKNTEFDLFRSKPLRYFGLANEFFKSLRPLSSCTIGNIGGIITMSYIFSDVFEKSRKVAAVNNKTVMDKKEPADTVQHKVGVAAGDALLWQTMASVLFPGIILDAARLTTCRFVSHACASRHWVRTAPAIVALAILPFIIDPIDNVTDQIMDKTYRPIFKKNKV